MTNHQFYTLCGILEFIYADQLCRGKFYKIGWLWYAIGVANMIIGIF